MKSEKRMRYDERKGLHTEPKRRYEFARKDILDIIHKHHKIASKTLEDEAKKQRISSATLYKHIRDLINEGIIRKEEERSEKSLKIKVFYSTTNLTKFELSMIEIEKLMKEARSGIKKILNDVEMKKSEFKTFGEYCDYLDEVSLKYSPSIMDVIEKSHELLFELIGESPYSIAIGFTKEGGIKHLRIIPFSEPVY